MEIVPYSCGEATEIIRYKVINGIAVPFPYRILAHHQQSIRMVVAAEGPVVIERYLRIKVADGTAIGRAADQTAYPVNICIARRIGFSYRIIHIRREIAADHTNGIS